jgi:hypothetical protein
MKWITFGSICVITACAGAPAAPPGARIVSAETAPFASYRTFSFGNADPPREGYDVSPHSLEVQQHLAGLVEAAFVARGYVKSTEAGDFTVKLASGTNSETSSVGERSAVRRPEGFIGIDVYDRATGAEVWHGTAFAEISLDKIDDELLRRGITHMLAGFPTQGGSSAANRELSGLETKSPN